MQNVKTVQLLDKSSFNKNYAHSYILNLLRGLAALQVCIHHFRNHFYQSYSDVADPSTIFKLFAFSTGFANHAVMIFFAISGWLVGGGVLNNITKKNFTINYAIDRVTRLWVVLIPVFILSAAVVLIVNKMGFANDVFLGNANISPSAFFGNLFGLQTIFVDKFAANYPLWSLANETWYYVSFPLIMLLFLTNKSKVYKAMSLMALAIIICYLPQKIVMFSIVWLLGALISRVKINVNKWVSTVLLLLSLGVMTYGRYKNIHDSIYIVIGYTLPLLLFLSSCQKAKPKWMNKKSVLNNSVTNLVGHFLFFICASRAYNLFSFKRVFG